MKKIKLDGKLKLNKETIAKLNDNQMSNIKGGQTDYTCITCTEHTCERACTTGCPPTWNCPTEYPLC